MNKLGKEKSPYLLQHAHNPVDWHPWGEEACAKSRSEDKPILLSIGYSTCHWCHVMEKESFEDTATANLMNQHFISVKVDREERPDLDSVYMKYVMATTGSGGWPMTVFLTPDKKPFYGGTYFPPEDRYGMPGFKNLLSGIAEAWKTRRGEIVESAESAARFLQNTPQAPSAGKVPGLELLKDYFEGCAASFDPKWGGFGSAPKFPRPHALSLLLRYWKRTGDDRALEIVEQTLGGMARGGIHDHLGGGFHRYSTDEQWLVPHFEKMLYDQALIAGLYIEAYQATRKDTYAATARDILDYALGELRSPEGGFYSAEDADSMDPGDIRHKKEGAYYVWAFDEIQKALGEREADIFNHRFGVLPQGNALHDPHGELKNKNTLHEARSIEETAAHFGLSPTEARAALESAKKKLLALRQQRPKPHLDDKILTDWNGLMIAALAMAGQALNEPRYLEAATAAAEFVSKKITQENGRLWHRYREGEAAIEGHLDDYAFLIYGYLTFYQTGLDSRWLEKARQCASLLLDLFYDKTGGGFFLTAHDAEALIARPKEIYDGAVPSGNSVAALALFWLEKVNGDARFHEAADQTLKAFAHDLTSGPLHHPQMLAALDFVFGPADEIRFNAKASDPLVTGALKEIYLRFLPNKIIMLQATEKKPPTIMVCRGGTCQLPVADVAGLTKILDAKQGF